MEIDKKHPLVQAVKDAVDAQYKEGRNTTFSDLELETIIKDVDADTYLALIHHRKSVTSRR